ncbi:DJ-1 [Lentinula edodes]|nr:DJ-1 [Lentinula edodes]
MPSALILIADGTEEMEFTITYDTLVRAGVTCQSAFVHDDEFVSPVAAKGSRGIRIIPDVYFEPNVSGPDKFDVLVIPGGAKGAETISKNPAVQALIREYLSKEKLVGMICAGSMAALTAGLSKHALTSHPSVKAQLESDFIYTEVPVVVSDNLITSRGPGTAFPFALKLVEMLCGVEKRKEVHGPMVFPPGTPW